MVRALFFSLLAILLITDAAAAADPSERAAMKWNASQSTDAVYNDIKETLGIVPQFFKQFPKTALAGAWGEMKDIQLSKDTAITPKYKELIGLAVAAQVPCEYCTYFHTGAAKLNGASDEECQEAATMAAATRHWSTYLNGLRPDEAVFRAETDKIISYLKENNKSEEASTTATEITTPEQAYDDIKKTFGIVPQFLREFPTQGIVSAWKEMKSFQLSSSTKLSGKDKELVGVAVAAQIPCEYCVYFHKEAAKLNGATEQEIREALAMAAITRHWSTFLNGVGIDEATFRSDADKIFAFVKKQEEAAKTK